MKRGEIWTVAGGPNYAGKPRPAVIIQSNRYKIRLSATICMLTSHSSEVEQAWLKVEPSSRNGLSVTSCLMVDKITTLPRGKVGRKIGELDEADMAALNRAAIDFLGLADSPANSF